MMEHLKWADKIVHDAPYEYTVEFLNSIHADFIVHGDDIPVDENGKSLYDEVKDANMLRIVKRTEGVSTTDYITRVLAYNSKDVDDLPFITLASQNERLLVTSTRLNLFAGKVRVPTEEDVVIYVDGSFDLFHVGHAEILKKAKDMGTYLIVGIHDDQTVNARKGGKFPITTLNERVLSVLGCKHVDDVIIGPLLRVTKSLISSMGITYVVSGSHRKDDFEVDFEEDPYKVPKELKMMRYVKSDFDYLDIKLLIHRVKQRRELYVMRNKKKLEAEAYRSIKI